MSNAALYFKVCLFRYENRKLLDIDPIVLVTLILVCRHWDETNSYIKPTPLLKIGQDLAHLNNFRDVKKYLVLLHDKGMLIAKEYGKPSITGKYLHKYKPSAQGRLFITDFWQYYEDECKRLTKDK